MPINTKKVTGRRQLRFETLDDVLQDAETLTSKEVTMLGNWSLGQVFRHLSIAVNGSIDGFQFKMTAVETWVIRKFFMKRMITERIPSGHGRGFRWNSVKPGPIATSEGLDDLRKALLRFRSENKRSPHPAFGHFTPEEWNLFHLRHSELHLSFAKPVEK